jgi:hypothetical protein
MYIVRTTWGMPGAPRDIQAKTTQDVYNLLSNLGRDGVQDYEIIDPDGQKMDETQLRHAWKAERAKVGQ